MSVFNSQARNVLAAKSDEHSHGSRASRKGLTAARPRAGLDAEGGGPVRCDVEDLSVGHRHLRGSFDQLRVCGQLFRIVLARLRADGFVGLVVDEDQAVGTLEHEVGEALDEAHTFGREALVLRCPAAGDVDVAVTGVSAEIRTMVSMAAWTARPKGRPSRAARASAATVASPVAVTSVGAS